MMKYKINVVPVVLSIIYLNGCKKCAVISHQEINGLINNKTVIAYSTNCGATVDYDVNVSFKEKGSSYEDGDPGDIFFAYHGSKIKLEKISTDTIKVIFAAWEVRKQKAEVEGIKFIYEENWKVFNTDHK